MTSTRWKSLLSEWSSQLLTTNLTSHLDPADRGLTYLGFPPAGESAIASLESRLGVALPPSYRSFLQATDGFRVISPFTYRLRPAGEVDWFRVENQGWVETWNEPTPYDDPGAREPSDEEYFDYPGLGEHSLRTAHLFAMVQISDVDDGVMLLNPMAVTPDGEWEAWFLANWIPGAHRYASFAHMMVETYRSLRKLEKLSDEPPLPEVTIPGPKVPRHSVVAAPKPAKPKRPKRKRGQSSLQYILQQMAAEEQTAPASPELFELLNALRSADDKARAKTIRILQGKQKIRGMSTRHPDLVPLASELARSLPDPEARCVCVSLLTNITPDGPVPQWLTTALTDPNPWVQSAGLSAVYFFKGPELVAPITAILSRSRDVSVTQQAVNALSQIPDPQVAAELAALLERPDPPEVAVAEEFRRHVLDQYYSTIALALSRYGAAAVLRLTPLLRHSDPCRRAAAIVALRKLGDTGSRAEVAKLKADPDPGVRQQAEMCARIWGNFPGFEPHALA